MARRLSSRTNGPAGTTCSGAQTPGRSSISPDSMSCTAIDGGAPVSMSGPIPHPALRAGVAIGGNGHPAATVRPADNGAQHFVAVRLPDRHRRWKAANEREQHIARHDARTVRAPREGGGQRRRLRKTKLHQKAQSVPELRVKALAKGHFANATVTKRQGQGCDLRVDRGVDRDRSDGSGKWTATRSPGSRGGPS